MRLIKPSFEILEQGPGLQGIYKQIELAGRTCYKSLDKITEDSAEGFVNRMIASKHYAMLEHGTVYLKYKFNIPDDLVVISYSNNPYSKVHISARGKTAYITTNLRVLVENEWLDDLQYLCEPTEHHEKRVTVRFTTSNGIMREFTRHRSHSFAVESTRYCNYFKDKFNNELTFIIPYWLNVPEGDVYYDGHTCWIGDVEIRPRCSTAGTESEFNLDIIRFIEHLVNSEVTYLDLIRMNKKPQEAREVLPLATKCDMVMTGFVSDWQHFFDLRARGTTGAPHPDAKALAEPLMHEFERRNLI